MKFKLWLWDSNGSLHVNWESPLENLLLKMPHRDSNNWNVCKTLSRTRCWMPTSELPNEPAPRISDLCVFGFHFIGLQWLEHPVKRLSRTAGLNELRRRLAASVYTGMKTLYRLYEEGFMKMNLKIEMINSSFQNKQKVLWLGYCSSEPQSVLFEEFRRVFEEFRRQRKA